MDKIATIGGMIIEFFIIALIVYLLDFFPFHWLTVIIIWFIQFGIRYIE